MLPVPRGPDRRKLSASSHLGNREPAPSCRNAFIESFNGEFRAECLNTHWFMSLDDAKAKMGAWRGDTNEVRLHSAIGHKTPIELMRRSDGGPPA